MVKRITEREKGDVVYKEEVTFLGGFTGEEMELGLERWSGGASLAFGCVCCRELDRPLLFIHCRRRKETPQEGVKVTGGGKMKKKKRRRKSAAKDGFGEVDNQMKIGQSPSCGQFWLQWHHCGTGGNITGSC